MKQLAMFIVILGSRPCGHSNQFAGRAAAAGVAGAAAAPAVILI